MILAAGERRARPLGAPPAGARRPRPPLVDVAQVDRPAVRVNTSDPGRRFSAGAPGNSAGSSGRSATVTYPVWRRRQRSRRLLTGSASIQKPSTATRRVGALLRIVRVRAHPELGRLRSDLVPPVIPRRRGSNRRRMLTTVQPKRLAVVEDRLGVRGWSPLRPRRRTRAPRRRDSTTRHSDGCSPVCANSSISRSPALLPAATIGRRPMWAWMLTAFGGPSLGEPSIAACAHEHDAPVAALEADLTAEPMMSSG